MAHWCGKRAALTACKLAIGLSLLGFVLWRNWDPANGPGLSHAFNQQVRIGPLILAATFFLLSLCCGFLRWYSLVRIQGLSFTLRDAFRLGFIGYFWSTLLPGSVGGDVVKATLLAKEQSEHGQRTAAVATVLVDRVVGLTGLIVMMALVGGMFWLIDSEFLYQEAILRSVVSLAATLAAIILVVGLLAGVVPASVGEWVGTRLDSIPWVGSTVAGLWRAMWLYRLRKTSVCGALVLAILGHVGHMFTFYFASQVFQTTAVAPDIPPLTQQFLIVPAGLLFQTAFPSPGGVGGGEYGFGQLYVLVGKSEAQGVLSSLAVRAITWGMCLVGVLVYVTIRWLNVARRSAS